MVSTAGLRLLVKLAGQVNMKERNKILLAVGLALMPILIVIMRSPFPVMRWNLKEAGLWRDSRMVFDWEGFGPERGMYNFTVVTALLDIGRGHWGKDSRGLNEYLLYMQRVLRLDVNMVIYVAVKGRPMVQWMRRGRENRTRIIDAKVEDVPYFKYRDRIQEIMNSDEYQRDNELFQKRLVESIFPEYDIVQWAKLYFLHEVIQSRPFSNDYFVWIDAGYGRGEDIHPKDGIWKPRKLLAQPDKVTFLMRDDPNQFRADVARLHKMSLNILAGGFFGGGGRALERLYELQQEHVREWMETGVVDDDQTIVMQLYFKHPHLFNLVSADWYDGFKIS
ncbi:protein HtrL-like [Littorina saxatilis]|uniref:protein HtrL-like n=1 Tax=Littorina saxatilis TaxID=31220 RepID=UPI0038B44C7C